MATAHDASKETSRVASFFTTDFCPWANRFVYWLKEPVGWFVLATIVSVMVGMYVSPVGWTLAASLVAIIITGMVWPWIAIRAVSCALRPETASVHEEDACHLILSVRNRFPLPIWGLAVQGFLDRKSEDAETDDLPTVALAYVRGLSICSYRFSIHPALRGRYPDATVLLTCSFPFGIWTAKSEMTEMTPLTVWPRVFPIAGQNSMSGNSRAEHGEGSRPGRTGDFIGVREYRHGDCAKQVNWVATARSDSLIVTERGGPQCPSLFVTVDDSAGRSRWEIADRIRVAASLLANLHQSAIPLRLRIGARTFVVRRGHEGFVQMMDALTQIPADGDALSRPPERTPGTASITITSQDDGNPIVYTDDPSVNHRLMNTQQTRVIDRNVDIADQLSSFWTEVRDETLVA